MTDSYDGDTWLVADKERVYAIVYSAEGGVAVVDITDGVVCHRFSV